MLRINNQSKICTYIMQNRILKNIRNGYEND